MSTNVRSFEQKIISEVQELAPLFLTVSALISFIFIGYVYHYYYLDYFKNFGKPLLLGIVASSLVELVRFAFLITSTKNFQSKDKWRGMFALLMSIALLMYDVYIASMIGLLEDDFTMKVFCYLAFGLEIQLVVSTIIAKPKRLGKSELLDWMEQQNGNLTAEQKQEIKELLQATN